MLFFTSPDPASAFRESYKAYFKLKLKEQFSMLQADNGSSDSFGSTHSVGLASKDGDIYNSSFSI